jgi:hypothetical protein
MLCTDCAFSESQINPTGITRDTRTSGKIGRSQDLATPLEEIADDLLPERWPDNRFAPEGITKNEWHEILALKISHEDGLEDLPEVY